MAVEMFGHNWVDFLVFSSSMVNMLTCFGFPLLNWSLFYKIHFV